MNIEVLKTKTALASLVMLALSGVRVAMGDASGVQGVQEAVFALVPIFLRAAIGKATDAAETAADAANSATDALRAQARRDVFTEAAPVMPSAGDQ